MGRSKYHAYEARFLFMIEFTASVAFLMSSVYGSGQANSQPNKPAEIQNERTASEMIRPLTDSKEVEK